MLSTANISLKNFTGIAISDLFFCISEIYTLVDIQLVIFPTNIHVARNCH